MILNDLRFAYRALKRTGVLGSSPLQQLISLLRCYIAYGVSLYTILAWAAQRYPTNTAVQTEKESINFSRLLLRTEELAKSLDASGLQPKQTVALLMQNNLHFIENILGCARVGANILLLNTKFSSAEIQDVFQNQAIHLIICDTELQHLLPMNTKIPLRLSHTRDGNPQKKLSKRKAGSISILTSGSTGRAKAIRRKPKPKAVLQTLTFLLEQFSLQSEQKILLTLPMFHGHGLATLLLSLVTGSTLHIFNQGNTKNFLERIEKYNINVLVLVPTILYRILEQTLTPTSITTIISGSAPLSPELVVHTTKRFGHVLFNIYGSSEAGIIAVATPTDLAQNPSTVGKPLPHTKIQLLEDQEIQIHSDFANAIINTGDLGYLEHHRLFLLGRKDDLIICGGENIYPEQLEQKILQLEQIAECAVKGIPDDEYGQAIHLFVVLKNNATLEALEADLQRILPRASRPKRISVLLELPKNAIGKLQRHRLDS